MIWRLSDLPELQHLSAADRHRLLRAMVSRGFYLRVLVNTVARTLGVVIVLYLIIFLTDALFYSLTGGQRFVASSFNAGLVLIGTFVLFLVLLPVMYQRTMRQFQHQVRDALRDAERAGERLPVCPDCAYALEGVVSSQCPECGRLIQTAQEHGTH
ncbi:MAG: hypothetical protein AAGA29_12960 [Planctomycetota bacterium]